MPLFRFTLHGTGIKRDGRAAGFYTTRWSRAASMEAAAAKAIESVRQEWTSGASAYLSPGCPPASLVVEKGWPIGLLDILSAPNKGNTIYFEDQ